jgi:4-hydroxy-tetrahydrodipicolinate synthase
MMMRNPIFGVGGSLTALATPFRDTCVDWAALSRLCDRQIDRGTAALIVCGSTGEAAALTLPEYARAVRTVAEAASGRVPVIAGCTALATSQAVATGSDAASAGADALLCAVPPYVKPTQDGIMAHIRAIAHATDLPIVLYDVPFRSGVAITDDTVARLHDAELIVGLKDATADLSRPTRLRARCGDAFMLWSGDDATAPGYRAMGDDGCISVTANVAPALCALLHRAWDNGDLGKFCRAARPARSAACRAVQREQPNPLESGAGEPRFVYGRGAAAADSCHSGDAGAVAGSDAAGDFGRGACGARAGLCAGELAGGHIALCRASPQLIHVKAGPRRS